MDPFIVNDTIYELYIVNSMLTALSAITAIVCLFTTQWGEALIYGIVFFFAIVNFVVIWSNILPLLILWQMGAWVLIVFAGLKFAHDLFIVLSICTEMDC